MNEASAGAYYICSNVTQRQNRLVCTVYTIHVVRNFDVE